MVTAWLAPAATVALAIGGGGCWEAAWRAWHWRWIMRKTPPSRIRSVAMGRAVLTGTVRLAELAHTTPASDRPAVCWELRGGLFRLPLGWEGASRADPFWLEDETGRILVEAAGCRLELPEYSTEWDDGSMVHERSVGQGDRVVVLGEVVPAREAPVQAGDPAEATGLVRRPKYGELVICSPDRQPADAPDLKTQIFLWLGLVLLLGAALVAPRGILAHPLRTLGEPMAIGLGTLACGAGVVRFLRGFREAVRSSDPLELLFSSYALVVVLMFWWLGTLAGIIPVPFR